MCCCRAESFSSFEIHICLLASQLEWLFFDRCFFKPLFKHFIKYVSGQKGFFSWLACIARQKEHELSVSPFLVSEAGGYVLNIVKIKLTHERLMLPWQSGNEGT